MLDLLSIIEGHNKFLLQPKITKHRCNCRVKNSCLQNLCQTQNLIYRADVENIMIQRFWTYCNLKNYGYHKKDSEHKQHSKNTELLKYMQPLKDVKIPYNIEWSIVEKVYGKTKIGHCCFWRTENLQSIEYFDDILLVNKRSESLWKSK